MKVYIGQINSTVGALTANAELIRRAYDEGVQAGADVSKLNETLNLESSGKLDLSFSQVKLGTVADKVVSCAR